MLTEKWKERGFAAMAELVGKVKASSLLPPRLMAWLGA
jgi:hypothetical protein